MSTIRSAYSAGAGRWASGPARLYQRLAQLLVDFSPVPLQDRAVLDLGSGTGDGSRAAGDAGASVVAIDIALGMLLHDRDSRPPGVVGDACALPFREGAFDVVLAPFSLNHLDDPSAGVTEAARVGDALIASTYASDDDHPAKRAVERALEEVGWERPLWYDSIKASMAAWGTVEAATAVVETGGMTPLRVECHEIAFPELTPADMVSWRMGLAQSAAFVDGLCEEARTACFARALELLGPEPAPILRRVIFLAAT